MENKIIIRDVANIILINSSLEILIQKKDMDYKWFPGGWCLPGGAIEEEEAPEDCLKRELTEEYGYKTGNIKLFTVQDYENILNNTIKRGKQYCFTADFKGKISDIKIKEGNGFGFFGKSEIYSIPITHNDLKLIEKYFGLKNS